MKPTIISIVAAAGLMATGSALAADMPELAKKNNCHACHAIDKKMNGPSWTDIAKKYKANAAKERPVLITKIIKGGGGVWKGPMPIMPPNPKVTEADAGKLVDFIMGLAK